MSTELLDEASDDAETVVIAWLAPLLSAGSVANDRRSGGPLPFYLVTHLHSNESQEESTSDALVSVKVLTHKAAGQKASRDEADRMHRHMLILARHLEGVDLADDGREATISSLSVFQSPVRAPYGDEQILCRSGRYTLGLPYAKI